MNRRDFISTAGLTTSAIAFGAPFVSGQVLPPRIRIGQIGTKHAHASGKLSAIRNLPDLFEVVGIVEPDAKRRESAQRDKAFQELQWMTEEQLLNTKGLQAVAVETEVCDLLATAERCVAAGVSIHLDKPAGESLPHFRRVLATASQRKLTVQMGYMFRYNPAFQLAFRAVSEGWLGEVFSIDAVMGKVLDKGSRQSLLKYPGGAMFELGCHVVDSVVKILGKPQRVTAHGRSSSAFKDGLLDNQLAVFDYANASATVRANFVEVEGGVRRQFVVCGTKGTLDISPLEPPRVRLALDAPRESFKKGYQDIDLPKLPRYDGEFMDLAKVIRGEKAFEWTPEHDLAVQEAVLLGSGLPVA